MSRSKHTKEVLKIALAITLGNTIAWADFALYAYFAPVLSKVFFPFTTQANAYILYFIVFALGFFFRPIGSAIAGAYADRHGRKNTLVATVAISSIVTGCIGLLPSYSMIGFLSPLLLTFFRILQTMAVSAEPTNSGSLLIEHANPKRKGFVTSAVMVGVFIGFLLGIFSFYVLTSYLNTAALAQWGWRLSFVLFALLGIFVVIVLMGTNESPLYLQKRQAGKLNPHPLKKSFSSYRMVMFVSFGYSIMMAVANYYLLGFVPEFLNHNLGISLKNASLTITICLTLTVILIPLMGYISDYVGRRIIMGVGATGFILFGYPMTILIVSHTITGLVFAMIIYGVFLAPVAAVLPAAVAEMFPFEVRCTAGALGYNLALVLLGGTTPIIVETIVRVTGNLELPFWYITFVAIIHLFFVVFSKETKDRDVTV